MGNRRILTAKETASTTAKIIVSRLSKEILTSVPPLGRYLLSSNKKLFPKISSRLYGINIIGFSEVIDILKIFGLKTEDVAILWDFLYKSIINQSKSKPFLKIA